MADEYGDQDPEIVPQAPAPIPAPPAHRPPVNYQPAEAGWWLATDSLWYPPEMPRPADVPALVSQGQPLPLTVMPKSRLAAGLLGIFLGGLGVHRFYLGNVGLGMLMLLVSLLSFGFLAWVVAIWGFMGVVILAGGINTDKRGIPLI